MSTIKGIVGRLLPLALFALTVFGAVRLFVAGVRTFEGLDKQVAAALVAGFASVVVATFTVVGSRYLERRSQREEALRVKKTAIYESFVGGMFDVFDLGRRRTDETADAKALRIAQFLGDLTPQLVTWASNDVVATWSRTKRRVGAVDTATSPLAPLLAMEEVLRAIRKDLGHSARGLEPGDLLGLFVNDIDQYLLPPTDK